MLLLFIQDTKFACAVFLGHGHAIEIGTKRNWVAAPSQQN